MIFFENVVNSARGSQGAAATTTPVTPGDLMYDSGYNPPTQSPSWGVTGSQPGNIFGQSAGAYGTGTQALSEVASPYAMPATMNQFINPYRNAVIDNALYRSREQQDISLNDVRGQAAQSSAYGGARQGLVEAELMDRFNQNDNELLARLLQQGFDTRSNLALNTLSQRANAGQALVGAGQTGLGMGQSINQGQGQAGMLQQQLMQMILGQASGQTETMLNYPVQALGTAISGVSGNPLAGNISGQQSYTPGIFDYMSMASGMMGGGK